MKYIQKTFNYKTKRPRNSFGVLLKPTVTIEQIVRVNGSIVVYPIFIKKTSINLLTLIIPIEINVNEIKNITNVLSNNLISLNP